MSSQKMTIALEVNGETVESTVPVRLNLVDFLRGELGLTGSHVGCEHGVCGACTVLVDGEPVRGCLMLAVQADGSDVTQLTTDVATDQTPAFSPDGTMIAFATARDGNLEIYVMKIDGTGKTRLTNTDMNVHDGRPVFTPDGSQVLPLNRQCGHRPVKRCVVFKLQ